MNVLNYLWSPCNGEAHGRELDIFVGAVPGHLTCGKVRVIGKIRPPRLMSVFTDSKTAAAREPATVTSLFLFGLSVCQHDYM